MKNVFILTIERDLKMKKILIFFIVLILSSISVFSQDTIPYQPDIPCTSDSSWPGVAWKGHPTNPSHPNLILSNVVGVIILLNGGIDKQELELKLKFLKYLKLVIVTLVVHFQM